MIECPNGHKTEVIESLNVTLGGIPTKRRRRGCKLCNWRGNTAEIDWDLAKEVLSED